MSSNASSRTDLVGRETSLAGSLQIWRVSQVNKAGKAEREKRTSCSSLSARAWLSSCCFGSRSATRRVCACVLASRSCFALFRSATTLSCFSCARARPLAYFASFVTSLSSCLRALASACRY